MTTVNQSLFSDWLNKGSLPENEPTSRIDIPVIAALAWSRIQDSPTKLILRRGKTMLAIQTVRLEYDNKATEKIGMVATPERQTGILFGIRGHDVLPDTDVKRGDRFVWQNADFELLGEIPTSGEIQMVFQSSKA